MIEWHREEDLEQPLEYPHSVPRGWHELVVWTGIADIPVWAVRDKEHVELVLRTVGYRLIVRSTRPMPLVVEPTVQSEVLRRVVFPDYGVRPASTKYRWKFLEFDHYVDVDTLKAEAEKYHNNLLREWNDQAR